MAMNNFTFFLSSLFAVLCMITSNVDGSTFMTLFLKEKPDLFLDSLLLPQYDWQTIQKGIEKSRPDMFYLYVTNEELGEEVNKRLNSQFNVFHQFSLIAEEERKAPSLEDKRLHIFNITSIDDYQHFLDVFHSNNFIIVLARPTKLVPAVRKKRAAKEEPTPSNSTIVRGPSCLASYSQVTYTNSTDPKSGGTFNKVIWKSCTNQTAQLDMTTAGWTFSIVFSAKQNGEWLVSNATVSNSKIPLLSDYSMDSPGKFSFVCNRITFVWSSSNTFGISIDRLQILPFGLTSNSSFPNEINDCIGYMSIPIFMGWFVSAIIMIIITYGFSLLFSIKSVDKFEDSKGPKIMVTKTKSK
ncbi:hypothetical protein SNEBB_004337 [Seison nebaliae]|nr:hypothetical protein SNEBB_004337 [Seison nebaliae]